jgi:HPt (histidine-containing phosphotransfer) domain-containing protein
MQITNEAPEPGLEPFVPKFIDDRLSEISVLLAEKNISSIQTKAHQWKGFSRPYGFAHLEAIAKEIEKSDLKQALDLLIQAEDYCKKRAELLP